MSSNLNPQKALIFRIVHIQNVPWILEHGGVFARTAPEQDPNYMDIGSPELIDKRNHREVPIPPGGSLSDYVPFYFTPFSIMMYNITTGYQGITRRPNQEIVICVSSLHHIAQLNLPFVFTDGHAYMKQAQYFNKISELSRVDWTILQNRNFKRDPDCDPNRPFRYQAEALVHQYVPLNALLAMVCFNDEACEKLCEMVNRCNLKLEIKTHPSSYFK